MRRQVVLAAVVAVAFGLSACGKYGPPVRTVKEGASSPSETRSQETRPEEPTLDETTTQPSEFEF
jgi:hypothetical protein